MKTRRSSMATMFSSRVLFALEFDTEEAKKKYQQEHEVRPKTKLEVKKKKTESPVSVQKPEVKKKTESHVSIQRPEYHSGDYGSWISPEGEMHPVKGFQEHMPALAEVFKQKKIKGKIKGDGNLNDYAVAFKHGYVRVNNDPMSIEMGGPLTLAQKDALIDLAGQYAEKSQSTSLTIEMNGNDRYFSKDEEGSYSESFGTHGKLEDVIRNASMKTRRSSMVSIDTVTGPHSMTPNDTWVEVDGGKPTGNANSFPLDDTGSAQKEIIRQVNQNRNDITSLAASELVRIAKSLVASSRVVEVMPMSDSAKVKAEQYLKERFEIEVVGGIIYADTRDKIDAKTLGKELKKAGISVMTSDFKLASHHLPKLSTEEEIRLDSVMDAVQPKGFTGTDVAWTLVLGEYENEFGKIGSGS